MHHPHVVFSYLLLSLHTSTGERQEWMEALQTAAQPSGCGSQKRSDSLPKHSSANKRGLLELRGYKGRVLVSLAGSKVRLCKTEQVLPTPPRLPLHRMTASCLIKEERNDGLFEADEAEREMFLKGKEIVNIYVWKSLWVL